MEGGDIWAGWGVVGSVWWCFYRCELEMWVRSLFLFSSLLHLFLPVL